jgi:hypothetical protein
VLEETLAQDDGAGERFYDAELHRLRGELLVAVHPDRLHDAHASFRRALAVARSQGALPLAARAAANLGCLGVEVDTGTLGRPATTTPAKRRPKRPAAQAPNRHHSPPDPSPANPPAITTAAALAGDI